MARSGIAEGTAETAMAHITDMLGTAFRDKLIARLGGTQIKAPQSKAALSDHHLLVVALGRVDAEELVEVLPAEQFYIPRGTIAPAARLEAVMEADRCGDTNAEIARRLGISDRHVRRLRAKGRAWKGA